MILLKATSESLQIVTANTGNIDYSVSYADITTTAFTPSTSEGKITAATTTTLLTAPAASTQRQVKLITISNINGSTSNTVTIQKLISATSYVLQTATTLLPNEVLQYMDGQGWVYYSATGAIKGSQTAAGSTTQIQFNNNGVLAGDSGFTFDSTTDIFGLNAAGSNIQLGTMGISNSPATPSAGLMGMYTRDVASRLMLGAVDPSGLSSTLQPFIGRNAVINFRAVPGATTITGNGIAITAVGTATAQGAFATTNIYTSTVGVEFLVTTAATTAVAGFRVGTTTATMPYWRGNVAGMGGFFVIVRFGPATGVSTTSTRRMFVGMQSGTAAPTDVNPSTLTNIIGAGFDSADTNWQVMFNDGSGTATKVDTGIVKPSADRTNRYEVAIFCAPNATGVTVQFSDLASGGSTFSSTNTSDIPANTTFLGIRGYNSVGGTSSVTGFGLMSIYSETDT